LTGCGSSASSKHANQTPQTAQAPGNVSLPDLIARVRSGIVRIESNVCNGTVLGTGFLVDAHDVATVEHVVDGATEIALSQNGKVVGTGTVIGEDASRDIALVHTSSPLAGYHFTISPRAPRLAEEVATLGFPLGLPLTVTRGIVSGSDRTIPIDGIDRKKLVQTDAAVNHGNSGGPVISTETGEVVGLVDLGLQGNALAFAVSGQVAAPLLQAWKTAPQPVAAQSCGSSTPTQVASPPPTQTTGSTPASFVRDLDGVLVNYSAQSRAQLADTINAVSSGGITMADADAAIAAVVNQRRSFLAAAEQVVPPSQFQQPMATLIASLQASIADDTAIGKWADAKVAGATGEANQLWAAQQRLSFRASKLKTEFCPSTTRFVRTCWACPR
jgi:S1-C subfamily serine protease